MTGRWRALVAGLLAAVVLAGCSGDENTLTQPGPSQEPGSSAQGAEEVPGEPIDADDPDAEATLAGFYDEFLLASDLHRTPDELVAESGSGLEELASPAVVAEADAWRSANEAHGDSFERVDSLFSVANITGIEVDEAVATIEDCTAQTSLMTTGQEITEYLTRVVRVANEGTASGWWTSRWSMRGAWTPPATAAFPAPWPDRPGPRPRHCGRGSWPPRATHARAWPRRW